MQTTEETEGEKGIQVHEGIVDLAVSIPKLKERMDTFLELKKELLKDTDYETIGKNKFIVKSGWQKLALAFGISDEIVKEYKEEKSDGTYVWRFHVKATHRLTGRFTTGVGSCASTEKVYGEGKDNKKLEHDVYSMAHTRAKLRAIRDMIGSEDMLIEEVDNGKTPNKSNGFCECHDGKNIVDATKGICKTCGLALKPKGVS